MQSTLPRIDLVLKSASGREFSADVHLPASTQNVPVVVFVHGFKGFKDWGYFNLLGSYFAAQGFAFAKLNFSHNGTTPDNPLEHTDLEAFAENNFSKELSDLQTFIDFLSSSPAQIPTGAIGPNQLFIIGHSRGGSVALIAAAEDARIKAAASWAAVSDLEKRWSAQELEQWKKDGVEYIQNMRTGQQMPLNYQIVEDFQANKDRFSVVNAAAKLQNRLLIVHGDCDDAVPVSDAHELAAANPASELLILTSCDHSFGGAHPYQKPNLPNFAQAAADASISFFKQFCKNA